MNTHISLLWRQPLHVIWHGNLRRWLAAVAIATLVALGIALAWREAHPFKLQRFLFALIVTIPIAFAYWIGYFCVFPDVLGGKKPAQNMSMRVRWSNFARTAVIWAAGLTFLCWAVIVWQHFRGIRLSLNEIPSMVGIFVFGTLTTRPGLCIIGALVAVTLMFACVAASERYLEQSIRSEGPTQEDGAVSRVVRGVGRCGAWLLARMRPKRILLVGALLLLFSLVTMMDIFEGFGYQVVSGTQHWPTAEYTLPSRIVPFLAQTGRAMYIAGILLACTALLAAALGRRGMALRNNRAVGFLSMTVALFCACDLAMGVARLDDLVPQLLNLAVLGVIWIVPIAIWMRRSRMAPPSRDHSRVAILVFYLPICCIGFALFPLALILVPSYGFFMAGSVLLALGFLQSRWEMAFFPAAGPVAGLP